MILVTDINESKQNSRGSHAKDGCRGKTCNSCSSIVSYFLFKSHVLKGSSTLVMPLYVRGAQNESSSMKKSFHSEVRSHVEDADVHT